MASPDPSRDPPWIHSQTNATVDLLVPNRHARCGSRRARLTRTARSRDGRRCRQVITVVLLPGTGSDDDYVYRAFSAALHDVGAMVVTPPPRPERLVGGYLTRPWTTPPGVTRPHRGRRRVDRRGGRHRPGRWRHPVSYRRGAGRPARMDGSRQPMLRAARCRAAPRISCAATGWPSTVAAMRASSPPWLARRTPPGRG